VVDALVDELVHDRAGAGGEPLLAEVVDHEHSATEQPLGLAELLCRCGEFAEKVDRADDDRPVPVGLEVSGEAPQRVRLAGAAGPGDDEPAAAVWAPCDDPGGSGGVAGGRRGSVLDDRIPETRRAVAVPARRNR
jgi:hypothetical protein